MAEPKVFKQTATLAASAARTASGDSGNTTLAQHHRRARVFLDVSARSGTSPTLDVHIRSKDPVSGNMVRIASFAQMTNTGNKALDVEALGTEIDAEWEVGGTTPSFTFSVGAVFER